LRKARTGRQGKKTSSEKFTRYEERKGEGRNKIITGKKEGGKSWTSRSNQGKRITRAQSLEKKGKRRNEPPNGRKMGEETQIRG